MIRHIFAALLVAALSFAPAHALPSFGPGSAADAREAYDFFFARLQEVYFASNGERVLRATEIASQIATAGKGAAQEAREAYQFFFARLQEVYFASNGERIQSAISSAVTVGRAGRGAAKEAQESYAFFYSKLQEVYFSSNADRIKAAMTLALKVATEGPPALQPNGTAVTALALNRPSDPRRARRQRVLNHFLLHRKN